MGLSARWLVMRWTGKHEWAEVRPPDADPYLQAFWEAPTAGEAFKLAVLENPRERMLATSYRVVPWDGGVTFDVDINVNAVES